MTSRMVLSQLLNRSWSHEHDSESFAQFCNGACSVSLRCWWPSSSDHPRVVDVAGWVAGLGAVEEPIGRLSVPKWQTSAAST